MIKWHPIASRKEAEEALRTVPQECKLERGLEGYGMSYAEAALNTELNDEDFRTQLLYVLSNLKTWRGARARSEEDSSQIQTIREKEMKVINIQGRINIKSLAEVATFLKNEGIIQEGEWLTMSSFLAKIIDLVALVARSSGGLQINDEGFARQVLESLGIRCGQLKEEIRKRKPNPSVIEGKFEAVIEARRLATEALKPISEPGTEPEEFDFDSWLEKNTAAADDGYVD